MIKKIKEMKKKGLNLWASIEVSKLPQDITDSFNKQKIPYDQTDNLCLLGSGGGDLWNHLPHPLDQSAHPLDSFSIEHIKHLDGDANILYPHHQWTIPLQKIGRFLNISRPSLLGLDINDQFGVWFAYRGAFLTKLRPKTTAKESFESPCLTCFDKPCIKACPVHAVDSSKPFNLKVCTNHRLSKQSDCLQLCHARLACPYQQKNQYSKEQIQYHMTNIHLLKMLSDKVSMKLILLFIAISPLSSCSQFSKIITENKTPTPVTAPVTALKSKKISTSKKVTDAKNTNVKSEISGELSNGMTYEATPEEGGFVISFDPFMGQNDKTFANACNHLIARLYNDKIQDESHVSIKTDIDYIIFKGYKARYKAVPFKESNGEISLITLSLLK